MILENFDKLHDSVNLAGINNQLKEAVMINKQLQNKVQNLEKFNNLQKHNDPVGKADDRLEDMEK